MTSAYAKEWGIVVVALGLNLIGLWLVQLIGFGFWNNLSVLIVCLSILMSLSAVTAIALSLLQHSLSRIIFIALLLLISVAVGRFEISAGIGAVVLFVSVLGAARAIHDEITNRITFGTRVVYRAGTRLLAVGFIAVVLSYLLPTIIQYIDHNEALIKPAQLEPFIQPVQPLLNQIMPGFQPQQTVDDLIEQRVQEEEKKLPPGTTIPPSAREEIKAQLRRTIQAPVSGEETMTGLAASLANRYVGTIVHEHPLFSAAVVILVLYMTIYPFISLLAWPALAIIALVVWILRSIKVVVIQTESIPVERLRLL